MPNEEYLPKDIFDVTSIPRFSIEFISVGHRKCVSDFTCWTVQNHQHYIIHFNINGKAVLYYDDKTAEIKKNDIFVFFPNKTYRFVADHDNPLDYLWLSFSGDGADVIMNNYFLTSETPYCHTSKKLSPLFFEIINMRDSDEQIGKKYEKLYSLLNHITDSSYNFFQNEVHPDNPKNNNIYFLKALNYISENYTRNIKISELADNLFISRDYLYKLFTKNTGLSPSNFIIAYKLNEAMQLLANKNLSISEISDATGFYDVYHFSRSFKKHHKKTPTEYRRELSEIMNMDDNNL